MEKSGQAREAETVVANQKMRPNHRAKAVLSKVLLFGLHGTEVFLGVPWWLSGLRIHHCHKMHLGSSVAMVVA